MKKERLWTGTFSVNMTLNFIFYLVFYIPTIAMGTYAMKNLHASAGIAGILTGIFIVGGFLARLWTGNNIKRLGIKRMLYIGTAIFLIFGIAYYFVNNAALLLVVRFLHGIGFGISATASGTLAGAIVPMSRRGEGIGYFALSTTVASAIGPFLSMFLYGQYGFTILANLSNILLLFAFLGIFFIRVSENSSAIVHKDLSKKKFLISNYFEEKALPISILGLLVGIAYSSVLTFMDSYASFIHLATAGSFFFLAMALTVLVSRPLTGRLFDSKGDHYVMYPTFLLFAVGLALIGFAHNPFVLILSAVFMGLGYGSFAPFGQAIAIREAADQRLGVATSTFFGFLDLGVGLGPFIIGSLLPLVGYRNLYYTSALMAVIIAVLYYLMLGRKKDADF